MSEARSRQVTLSAVNSTVQPDGSRKYQPFRYHARKSTSSVTGPLPPTQPAVHAASGKIRRVCGNSTSSWNGMKKVFTLALSRNFPAVTLRADRSMSLWGECVKPLNSVWKSTVFPPRRRLCRDPAPHDCPVSRAPRLTGDELLACLCKAGLRRGNQFRLKR
jgi:hypothetical protein